MRSVGRTHPLFIARAQGAWVEDADGNRYVDLVGSWGPMILGHADPGVLTILKETAARGTSFGAPTVLEIELASAVKDAMPSIELVRFVSSGTEAAMSAIRLARAATGRAQDPQVRGLLPRARRRAARRGRLGPRDARDPRLARRAARDHRRHPDARRSTTSRPSATIVERHGDELACVIVEPVPGNMGCVPPAPGFLEGLREACDECGALLVLDEVMTGFRVARGGAQERYGVMPDLTVLGKIVGGGMPAAAFGGRGDLMERLAPLGAVYQAGTLSGNPLAMAAGLATLTRLARPETYEQLERISADLEAGLRRVSRGPPGVAEPRRLDADPLLHTGSRDRLRRRARASDLERFGAFFRAALDGGVYLRALAVRGRVRLARARPARDRAGRRGGRGVLPAQDERRRSHAPSGPSWPGPSMPTASSRSTRGSCCTTAGPGRRPPAEQDSLLGGDEQYAQGLARVAKLDDPEAIAVLAELIGLASRGRAEHGREADDFALWAATARFLADRSGREVYRTRAARPARRAATARRSRRSSTDLDLGRERAAHRALAGAPMSSARPLVGVIMGSTSDWEVMRHATETLERLGVPHEARVVSAHRTPDLLFEYAETRRGARAARC